MTATTVVVVAATTESERRQALALVWRFASDDP
jgi:hypothetical protein